MEEAGNRPLLVEPGPRRKIQHVDPVELVVLAIFDQPPDSIDDRWIGGLLPHPQLSLAIAHAASLEQITAASKQGLCHRLVIRNIGERSGCVVTTPTGITGSLSRRVTRNAPIILASASVASTSAKCAPTPNGR